MVEIVFGDDVWMGQRVLEGAMALFLFRKDPLFLLNSCIESRTFPPSAGPTTTRGKHRERRGKSHAAPVSDRRLPGLVSVLGGHCETCLGVYTLQTRRPSSERDGGGSEALTAWRVSIQCRASAEFGNETLLSFPRAACPSLRCRSAH